MNNFNFGEVLTRAWQNIWKYKVLWIFGILASCSRSGGGSGSGSNNQGSGSGDVPFSGQELEGFTNEAGRFFEQNWWIFVAVGVAIIFLAVIFFALGMMGRIGMIKGTALAEKNVDSILFAEVWSESLPYFWRVFGLNFLVGLVVLLIVIPFVFFGVLTAGVGFLCLLPLICVLIPLGWVVTVVVEQAQPAIVLEDLGMLDGLKRGWEVVKSNAVTMIIMSLILGAGGAIIGLIFAIPIIVAFIPVFASLAVLEESLTLLYISLACCALYMPVLIFLNGVLTAYIQSAWALTYMRLAVPNKPEELANPEDPQEPDTATTTA